MTAIKNIKSILAKHEIEEDDALFADQEKSNGLKTAMDAAKKQIEVSETIEAEAVAAEMEDAIAREMAKEMSIEFGVDVETPSEAPDTVDLEGGLLHAEVSVDAPAPTRQKFSERVLELQRKRDAVKEMRTHIADGSSLLQTLAKKSEQLSDYLAKAESELNTLEDTEAKYEKLHTASEALAREHRELKAKLEEKYQQVQLLEGQKHKNRDMFDKAQMEINRLYEQNKSQQSEKQAQDILLSKLKDRNLDLTEKNKVIAQEKLEITKHKDKVQGKLSEAVLTISENEKSLAKNAMQIENLARENEQKSIDLLDIQSRYSNLSEKQAELEALLEETKYELNSERNSFDEKLRLKDARILKLEKNIEVLTRQVSMTEDLVAEMSHDKAIGDMKSLLDKSRRQAEKTESICAAKGSKPVVRPATASAS